MFSVAKLYAGAGLLLALLLGVWALVHSLEARGAAQCKADQALLAAAQVQADRNEEQRRRDAQKEVDLESQRMAARARADADRLARAADQLRPAVAAIFRRCGSAVAPVGQAASSPGDLLAELQGRVESAVRATVDFADDAARAGVECAGKYDALTPAAPTGLGKLRLGQ